ncbi:MAG: M56 family metallopeptidase [Acidobacteriota bacterium]
MSETLALAVKSTLLLAGAACVAALLGRASAAARHLVWLAALASLLLLPVVERLTPAWPVALPARLAAPLDAGRVVLDVVERGGEARLPWAAALWAVWAAGFGLLAGRMALGYARARSIARRASPFPDAGDGVWLSPEISMPVVCGLWRPVVLMPREAAEWPVERLRLVMKHERMHIARHDTRTQALAQLVRALYWPQPLAWWAAVRMRKEADQACDDGVLAQGEAAAVYAGHLVEIVRGLGSGDRILEGGIAMARISELENRLKAMFNPHRSRRGAGPRLIVAAGIGAAALLLPVAALRSANQDTGAGITGVVRDASGATVPRARVTLAMPGRDRKEFALTSDAGDFSFRPLPEGTYSLSVAKPGFALLRHEGIVVPLGQMVRVELVLNLGQVVETLEVKGERPSAAPVVAAGAGPPTRIRVGGSVQQAKMVNMVRPLYPADCKAEGVEGTVLLRAVIGLDGSVLNLQPINELVDRRLVEAATEAVRQWRYQPTLLNGQPVEIITEIQVNFTLQK